MSRILSDLAWANTRGIPWQFVPVYASSNRLHPGFTIVYRPEITLPSGQYSRIKKQLQFGELDKFTRLFG